MGKYELNPTTGYGKALQGILNELAEANRLKILELNAKLLDPNGYAHDWFKELEDKA